MCEIPRLCFVWGEFFLFNLTPCGSCQKLIPECLPPIFPAGPHPRFFVSLLHRVSQECCIARVLWRCPFQSSTGAPNIHQLNTLRRARLLWKGKATAVGTVQPRVPISLREGPLLLSPFRYLPSHDLPPYLRLSIIPVQPGDLPLPLPNLTNHQDIDVGSGLQPAKLHTESVAS